MTDATPIDTVLLDMDGTLIDSNYQHAAAWARAFADEGEWAPRWRIHRTVGMGGDDFVTQVLGADVEERCGDALREGWQRRYEELLGEVCAFDGAADLVRGLRERGLKVALATSGEEELTDKALDILGLSRDDFDAVTSSADVEDAKPAPDLFQVALQKVRGRRGVVIGDSTWDCKAAGRTGVPIIGVLSGGFGADELREAGAAAVVDSVTDLVDADLDALVARAAPVLGPEAERATAARLFNETWRLLDLAERTPEETEAMINAAHASRHHWGVVGGAQEAAIGEWQVSRVYAELGRGEPALWHARRAVAISTAATGVPTWLLASAQEGLARAAAVAGDAQASRAARAEAERLLAEVSDPQDRAVVRQDLDSLPPLS